jgi:hypothetical protein
MSSLKEKLEKETRDKEALAKHAQDTLPKLLGTVQLLFRTLEGYLADVVNSGLATKDYGKTKLKPEYWDTVFFQVLRISLRKQIVELTPYGPVAGSPCRVNMTCGPKAYLLLWDGQGNSEENWKLKAGEGPKVESQQLTKESFDHALEKLVGL